MNPPPRVLIVEDEPQLRRVLVRTIAAEGFEVAEAASLEGARRLLAAHAFRAAVLDVGLPDGDGLSLLAELPPACALVVTANPDARVLARARPGPVLAKPFDLGAFRSAVRSLVERGAGAGLP